MLCMAIAAGATAAIAYLMEPVLDEVFIDKDRDMLILIPIVVIAVTLLKGGATYCQAVLMAFVGQRIIANLQSLLFAHVINFDLAFFHETTSGKLISRMTNDINLMRNAVSNALTGLIKDSDLNIFSCCNVRERLETRAISVCSLSHRSLPYYPNWKKDAQSIYLSTR